MSKKNYNRLINNKLIIFLSLIIIFFVFLSCKTSKKVTENTNIDNQIISTDINNQFVRDSIYIYKTDSFISIQKGDTVFITKINTQYIYLNKLKIDTIIKIDTVKKEIVQYKELLKVEKVKFIDKVKYGLIFGIILLTLFAIVKIYLKYRKNGFIKKT